LPLTLALGLAALSVGQLAWVAQRFVKPMDLAVLTASNPLVDALETEGTTVRASVASHDPILNGLLQNQLNTRRVSSLDISAASRIPDALSAFLAALAPDPERLWFISGVKNRAVPQSEFPAMKNDPKIAANIAGADGYVIGPIATADLPSHALVHFLDYLRKAEFVPAAEVIATPEAQLRRLKDPAWNPRQTVILDAADPAGPSAPATDAKASVDLSAYTSRRIEVAVQAPQPGYLLIDDAYDPDWSAEVNGQPAPVRRADFLLRAVAVPAGHSSVVLNYVAHYRVARLSLPAEAVNLFSDGSMLAAWIVAVTALRRRRF
jgi:hypothetical protein